MSGRMELLGVFALVLVVWAIVRMLDDDPRRSRRSQYSGHTFGNAFAPCPASGAYGVVMDTASSPAVSAGYGVVMDASSSSAVSEETVVEAEASTCGDDSGGEENSHWWSGEDDSGSRCDESDSGSSGSWDFGDD